MKYRLLLLKRVIEDVIMFPFIFVGRMKASRRPLQKDYRIFFFFPFYHTGGAEKIHSMIANAIGGSDCIIFFTRRSGDNTFLKSFQNSGCEIRDISKYTDNKWKYFDNLIYRGIVSAYINRQQHAPVVFNGQCNFGYKISPWIKKSIRQIELIHSLNSFSYIRIPFLPFIHKTVMISKRRIAEHVKLYKRYSIPSEFAQRIVYIPNSSEFDNITILQKDFSNFRVLYVGRGTSEKRVHLVAEIAKEVHAKDNSIQFIIAGDVSGAVNEKKFPFIKFMGNVADAQELKQLYISSSIVLITSSTEGFPLAVIEGMAYGCAIIATPVGDIPEHVRQNENGFLFSTVENEQQIIDEGANFILQLKQDAELLKKMGENNIRYAQEHFSYERFAKAYQEVLSKEQEAEVSDTTGA